MDNGASSYRRFLNGDENAFDEIVNELFHSLVFFINGYVRDIYASEDIAIDTFSDLIAYRNKYNFKVSLKTYIFMRAKNKAIDYIRHRKRIPIAELSEAREISDEVALEEIVFDNERKRVINKALDALPRKMREVVYLVYFEDMTYEETARVMKIKRKQVDNLLYRAKKELRNLLKEEGDLL